MAKWEPEHDDLLRKLNREGKSANDVAVILTAMGIPKTRNAVIARAHRLEDMSGYGSKYLREPPKPKKRVLRDQSAAPSKPSRLKIQKPHWVRPWQKPKAESALRSEHPTLLEREPGQCCWPINDGGPFRFCGKEAIDKPYCAEHTAAMKRPR